MNDQKKKGNTKYKLKRYDFNEDHIHDIKVEKRWEKASRWDESNIGDIHSL